MTLFLALNAWFPRVVYQDYMNDEEVGVALSSPYALP